MWRTPLMHTMRTKLVVVNVLLILFSLQLIGAYFVRALTSGLINDQTKAIDNQAQLLATIVGPEMGTLSSKGAEGFTPILSSFPQLLNGVVYLLNQEGVVVDTSAGTALVGQKRMDSIATQVLVARRQTQGIRFDPLNRRHVLAVAVPIFNQNRFQGLVEYVVPIQATYDTVRQVTTIFYTGSGIVLALATVLGIILSRTISRPVLEVTRQARTMAAGDFTRRVNVYSNDEFGDLSAAINELTDKLEDALKAGERERERLRAVIKYMGDGVVAFNAKLEPIFCNDAAISLMPDGKNDLPMAAGLFGLPNEAVARPTEHDFIQPVGRALIHVIVTPMMKNGTVDGYVAVLRDITEQEKLNRSRRDFVANVSHELRTPLTSIKSYIEALQDTSLQVSHEMRSKFLDVIHRETDRMVRLTRDLLQLSGLEPVQNRPPMTPIDVQSWMLDVFQRFHIAAKSEGMHFFATTETRSVIQGNRDMLDRVLDNLLSNALQYTPTGGRIELTVSERRGYVDIEVSDTGIGIPTSDIPHVFERFYRVDKARSRRRGGTGLGLALAREITEYHGGNINIQSRLNVGTTVTVALPVLAEGEVVS